MILRVALQLFCRAAPVSFIATKLNSSVTFCTAPPFNVYFPVERRSILVYASYRKMRTLRFAVLFQLIIQCRTSQRTSITNQFGGGFPDRLGVCVPGPDCVKTGQREVGDREAFRLETAFW